MTFCVRLLAISTLVLTSLPALAQDTKPSTSRGVPNMTLDSLRNYFPGAIPATPGEYKMSNLYYNGGQLDEKRLDAIFQGAESDKQYVLGVKNQFESAIRDAWFKLYEDNRNKEPGLVWLSNKVKATGQFMDAEIFFDAVSRFERDISVLEQNLEIWTSLEKGILPTRFGIGSPGNEIKALPPKYDIDWTEPKKKYATSISALKTYVYNKLLFRIRSKGVLPHDFPVIDKEDFLNAGEPGFDDKGLRNGFAVPPEKLVRPDDVIVDLTEEINVNRKLLAQYERDRDNFNLKISNQLQELISIHGLSQKWRNPDPDDVKARNEFVRELMTYFWMRSYLTAIGGIPLCAYDVFEYKKRAFEIDKVFTSLEDVFRFKETLECDQNHFRAIEDNIRQVLKLFTMSNARLSEKGRQEYQNVDIQDVNAVKQIESDVSSSILDGNVNPSVLVTFNSFVTFVAGNRPLADVGVVIARLLAADFYEQNMAAQGRYRELFTRYKARYYSNANDQKFYQQLEDDYFPHQGAKRTFQGTKLPNSIDDLVSRMYLVSIAQQGRLRKANALEAYLISINGGTSSMDERRDLLRPKK